MTGWEAGEVTDGIAFDHYVFGKPKIGRIRIVSIPDMNTLVANVLTENVHLVEGVTMRSQQGRILESDWASRGGGGKVIYTAAQTRYTFFQTRPDYANPGAILDVRVRQAIAHTLDKEGLAEAQMGPQGVRADTFMPPSSPSFGAINQAVTKYLLDPRRAQQLMHAAGFTRGPSGFYGRPGEGPLTPVQVRATFGIHSDVEVGALADGMRRHRCSEYILPSGSYSEVANTSPGIHNWSTTGYPDERLTAIVAARIPGPRWSGNDGGWSTPERLADSLSTTIEPEARTRLMAK